MKIIRRAAEAGAMDAGRFWQMTPVEIEWALAALAARQRRALEQADLLAWLTGRYVAFAAHAPKRYPRRPDGVRTENRPMSDAEMKRVLMNLAGREFE